MNYKILFDLCMQYSDNLLLVLSKDGLIEAINPQAETCLGWQKHAVLHKSIHEVFTETQTQPFIACQPITDSSSTVSYLDRFEQAIKVYWDIIPVLNGDHYECTAVIGRILVNPSTGSLEDLQLENILNYAPGLFYWKDRNSVYHGCNDEFARLAGLASRAQVKGKTDYDLIWREKAHLYIAVDKKVIESGIPALNYEETMPIFNDKPMVAMTNKVPLWNRKGEIVGLLGITMDITRQKEVEQALKMAKEEAEAASRAKTEFISNMTHDIRTPLAGVVGMSKMLEDSVIEPNQKQYAHWLGESGDQLLQMLNGILDVVSSDHVNEVGVHEEKFNIHRLIQDTIELERPSILIKGIEIKTEIAEGIPDELITDHIKLRRILLNLLGNAIKFSDRGTVEMSVSLMDKQKDLVLLRFTVKDMGIGIAEELQEKIFGQFFKIAPYREDANMGHGVGLHIAQSYARLLGSEIKIKSQLQLGTTFYFDLSLKIPTQTDDLNNAIMPTQSPSVVNIPFAVDKLVRSKTVVPENAPHVLLIEDNKIALLMLENIVTQAGYRYTSAVDGEMALAKVKVHHYDFIITDLGLPKLTGMELTRAIRMLDKDHFNRNVPIFGLTAHVDVKIKAEGIEAGMNKVFTKPLTAAMLESINVNYFSFLSRTLETQSTDLQGSLGMDLPDTEEELFTLDALPVINIEQALSGIGNDLDLLKTILSAMVEQELPQDLEELYLLHTQSDWDAIEKLAHRMKGGLMYCGTEKLVVACQYLERYRKAGHTKMLEPLYQQLCGIADKTLIALRQWLNSEVDEGQKSRQPA